VLISTAEAYEVHLQSWNNKSLAVRERILQTVMQSVEDAAKQLRLNGRNRSCPAVHYEDPDKLELLAQF